MHGFVAAVGSLERLAGRAWRRRAGRRRGAALRGRAEGPRRAVAPSGLYPATTVQAERGMSAVARSPTASGRLAGTSAVRLGVATFVR